MKANFNEKFQRDNYFTHSEKGYFLKEWLKDEIKECDKRIKSAESVLLLPDCLPENLTLSQREWEMITFRKQFLTLQLDTLNSF